MIDFKETWLNIKDFFSQLYEQIKIWVIENTILAVVCSGGILVVLICIILLISMNKKPEPVIAPPPFTISEPLVIPPSPIVPNEYNSIRETKGNWTENEIENWFTNPTDKEIDDLSLANDKIVSDIIGSAP